MLEPPIARCQANRIFDFLDPRIKRRHEEFRIIFWILRSTKLPVAAVTSMEMGLVTASLSPARTERVDAHAGRLLRKVHRADRGSHDPLGVADHAGRAGCRGRDADRAPGGVEASGSG